MRYNRHHTRLGLAQSALALALVALSLSASAGKSTKRGDLRPSDNLELQKDLPPAPVPAIAKRRDALEAESGDRQSASALDAHAAAGSAVERGQLDNGLKVFFVADRRTPSVVVQLWYRVGSADEPGGNTGISHFLEHMMFWNKEKKEENLYKRRIESMGGKYNAFTSYDFTAYYANVATVYMEEVLKLEAKRMRGLEFETDRFEKEREVVLEERHLRVNNRASGELREQMGITAIERSGLRNPIIGWDQDIRAITEADMLAWHKRWYQPANAALIVVGDTSLGEVMALAKRHFGRLDNDDENVASSRNRFLRLPEPKQKTLKRIVHRSTEPQELIKLLWKIPSLDRGVYQDERIVDSIGLDVLGAFLGQDKSGWLYRRLVRGRELALSVDVWTHNGLRDLGMFWIQARPRQGVSLDKLESAILETLGELKAGDIRDIDLERAQTDLIVETTYLRDSPFYQAYVLGQMEFSGAGWRMLDSYEPLVLAIDKDRMIQGLNDYLVGQPYTAGHLLPKEPPGSGKPVAR